MNENILITIVVPVYKVPYDLLRRCLDSICAQTSRNFEAILIDDGSPDECGDICDEYARTQPNLRVIHQQNGGLSVVRNTGIDNARGQWVCFVDGDDWIEPDTVAFAERYVGECGDGDVLIFDEYYDIDGVSKKNCFIEGAEEGLHIYQGEDKQVLFDMFFPRFYHPFDKNLVDIGTANARLYRRDFLIENSLYNKPGLKRMQDNVFNLWVFHRAQKVYYRCRRLYHYTFNDEAATKKYNPNTLPTTCMLLESMEEFVQQCDDPEEYYQRLYSRGLRILGELFKLNYANPDNPNPFRRRVAQAAQDFETPKFQEVIHSLDPRGHGLRTRFIRWMMKNKMYRTLVVYYSVSIRTRKLRLKAKMS